MREAVFTGLKPGLGKRLNPLRIAQLPPHPVIDAQYLLPRPPLSLVKAILCHIKHQNIWLAEGVPHQSRQYYLLLIPSLRRICRLYGTKLLPAPLLTFLLSLLR